MTQEELRLRLKKALEKYDVYYNGKDYKIVKKEL